MKYRKYLIVSLLILSAYLIIFTVFDGLFSSAYNPFFFTDSRESYFRARKSMENGDLEEARRQFYITMRSNPLFSRSFLDVSDLFLEYDDTSNALTFTDHAYNLAPLSYTNLWKITVNYLKLNEYNKALDTLGKLADVDKTKVFEISWDVYNDHELIKKRLVNDRNIVDYFEYLVKQEKIEESLDIWTTMNNSGTVLEQELMNDFVGFLVKNKRAVTAYSIWIDNYGESPGYPLNWNGGFEDPTASTGFDWIINQPQGVNIAYDRNEYYVGNYSLKLTFDGSENPDFKDITKIMPVEPFKKYIFSSAIKTQELTTGNGILWNISCYPDGEITYKTNIFTGTNEWTRVEKEIEIPDGCNALKAVLRRTKTKKYDRYLSGIVWIDDVRLTEAETR